MNTDFVFSEAFFFFVGSEELAANEHGYGGSSQASIIHAQAKNVHGGYFTLLFIYIFKKLSTLNLQCIISGTSSPFWLRLKGVI